jgi:hypothetical protein
MTQRRSGARVADRPTPGGGPQEFTVSKRPFATCGKLAAMIKDPGRIARSAAMLLDKSVLLNSALHRLFII